MHSRRLKLRYRDIATALAVSAALVCGVPAFTGAASAKQQASASATTSDPTSLLPAPTADCPTPVLTQPFLSAGDEDYYTLVGGESADNFDGGGWTLSSGASIEQATLADGSTGSVLDLPAGGVAVSPIICVTSAYPYARMEVDDVHGGEGISFNVYYGSSTDGTPEQTGKVHSTGHSWSLSGPVQLQAANTSGWQEMQITLIGNGNANGPSEFQLYNLYLDPRYAK